MINPRVIIPSSFNVPALPQKTSQNQQAMPENSQIIQLPEPACIQQPLTSVRNEPVTPVRNHQGTFQNVDLTLNQIEKDGSTLLSTPSLPPTTSPGMLMCYDTIFTSLYMHP